jgi:hypothetical protein
MKEIAIQSFLSLDYIYTLKHKNKIHTSPCYILPRSQIFVVR